MSWTQNKWILWSLRKLKFLAVWFFGITIGLVILYRFIPIPYTPLMAVRSMENISEGKPVVFNKDWEGFSNLPVNLQLAVVCGEDQMFLEHGGIDYTAIQKAVKHNKKSKRKRGASTISQQTAKNVFLWPSRSWIRKGFELYFTFLIEIFWSKERIMTVYLNVIEFGDGIYGAEAASQYFFKKPAIKLSNSEAALMAAVLPNPHRFSIAKPSNYTKKRQNWILRQMKMWGFQVDYENGITPGEEEPNEE
jgi:monofunctional glycosyltransferase